jgi:phosphatidylserine decarboxylase
VTGIEARDVPFGIHKLAPPLVVARGDEIGMFHLGSTAVLFVEKGAAPSFGVDAGPIRMGESLQGARAR